MHFLSYRTHSSEWIMHLYTIFSLRLWMCNLCSSKWDFCMFFLRFWMDPQLWKLCTLLIRLCSMLPNKPRHMLQLPFRILCQFYQWLLPMQPLLYNLLNSRVHWMPNWLLAQFQFYLRTRMPTTLCFLSWKQSLHVHFLPLWICKQCDICR